MARLRMLDDNHAAGSHEFRHYGVNSWGESSHKLGGVFKAQEISSDPFFPQFSWTWPLQAEKTLNIQLDRKQNNQILHPPVVGSEETATQEGAIILFYTLNILIKHFNPRGRQLLEIYDSISMLARQDLCNRFASNMQYARKWLRTLNKWKQIRTGSVFKCCRLRYERMRDDKNGLELFHEMLSYKFIKKLNLLDILPHTTGRNHSSPNENIPGGRSQPVRCLIHYKKKKTPKNRSDGSADWPGRPSLLSAIFRQRFLSVTQLWFQRLKTISRSDHEKNGRRN